MSTIRGRADEVVLILRRRNAHYRAWAVWGLPVEPATAPAPGMPDRYWTDYLWSSDPPVPHFGLRCRICGTVRMSGLYPGEGPDVWLSDTVDAVEFRVIMQIYNSGCRHLSRLISNSPHPHEVAKIEELELLAGE